MELTGIYQGLNLLEGDKMERRPPLPPRIGMDFDDTICQTKYEDGQFKMGPLMPGIKEAIDEASKDNEIVIFSARPTEEQQKMIDYLQEHGIIFSSVIKKPLFKWIVDDRSMKPEEFIGVYGKRR
jgi:hypothetical protein